MTVPKNDVKIGAVSLGCSKNRVDTELMLGRLSEAGYSLTGDPSKADVIIVNTCGFIDDAKEESINTMRWLSTRIRGRYRHWWSRDAFPADTRGTFQSSFLKWMPSLE